MFDSAAQSKLFHYICIYGYMNDNLLTNRVHVSRKKYFTVSPANTSDDH